MAKKTKNIRNSVIIPGGCRERYLPISHISQQILRNNGVIYSGISDLIPGYCIERVRNSPHMLIFTQAGKGIFSTKDQEWDLTPGTLHITPDMGHAVSFKIKSPSWRILWFYIHHSSRWTSLNDQGIRLVKTELIDRIEMAMETMLAETSWRSIDKDVASATPSREVELYSELLLHYIDRSVGITDHGELGPKNDLEQLWKKVEQDLGSPWSVDKMADIINVSASTLQRLTKKHYLTTPWAMLNRIRINQAKVLLFNKQYSIKVIAARLGYADEFVFSTAFKQHAGLSPRAYQRIG